MDLTRRVQDLGLGINQVLELYLMTEQREAEEGGKIQRAKNKRKAKDGQAEIDGDGDNNEVPVQAAKKPRTTATEKQVKYNTQNGAPYVYDRSNDVAATRVTKSQVLNTALVHHPVDIDGIDQYKNHTVINETITLDDSFNVETVSKRGEYFNLELIYFPL